MKKSVPDENGVVTVRGILSDGLTTCAVVVPPCECCGSRRDWSLFWLPAAWRDHEVEVVVRLVHGRQT